MPPKGKYFNELMNAVGVNRETDHDAKLFQAPKKPKREGKFMVFKSFIFQADVIYMPKDGEYNYILDVVDVSTRAIDAEPMRNRSSMDVIQAFEAIFKRKHISLENMIYLFTDAGTEFCNDEFDTYMQQNDILHRVTRVGRKNQMSIVEYFNGVLTKVLGTKMGVDEIRLEERGEWKRYLSPLVERMNQHKKEPRKIYEFFKDPIVKDSDLDLTEGDWVHVKLEEPRDTITNEKYNSKKFRNGDLRYSRKIYKIDKVVISNGQPVRFILQGITNASFMRYELVKALETNAQQKQSEIDRKIEEKKEKERKKAEDPNTKRQLVLRNRTAYV